MSKVRHLQRRLWAAARRSPSRRFHALYDRIYRDDVLEMAWKQVRSKGGAAEVDRQTLADVEEYGVERFLEELQAVLRAGRYRPLAVRGHAIPKAEGGQRLLGIPTVRDRVVQTATKIVHKRISGRLLEQGVRRYYLHRWPSERSMKRVRQQVKERTGRNRCGVRDVRVLIRDLNPVLRGWGSYFRTGNAAKKFNQLDTYVWRRLHRFLMKRKGRNLRAGEADAWNRDFFWGLGLHRLRSTIRYPGAA